METVDSKRDRIFKVCGTWRDTSWVSPVEPFDLILSFTVIILGGELIVGSGLVKLLFSL